MEQFLIKINFPRLLYILFHCTRHMSRKLINKDRNVEPSAFAISGKNRMWQRTWP